MRSVEAKAARDEAAGPADGPARAGEVGPSAAEGTHRPRVLLILPCYNEAGSIRALLEEIASLGAGYDTVVIDDGSVDDTYAIASRLSPCVRLLANQGIGGAVQTGIRYALKNGYDFCVQIDGDGQHPPDQVARLLARYRQGGCRIVVGSRYLTQDTFRSTWARRLGSGVIGRAIGLLFGVPAVTDPTSGMRLMDRHAIAFFAARYPHDFPEPISLAWALRHGLGVAEVAVAMRAREHGTSSIAGLRTLAYMVRVLGYVTLARVQRRVAHVAAFEESPP
jgi:glycosyltransferase involved in cell wall biosynthesis